MDGVSSSNLDIIRDLPHILQEWCKTSVNFATYVSYAIIENISIMAEKSIELTVRNLEILKEGINLSSIWWLVLVTILFFLTLPFYFGRQKTQKRLKKLTANIPGPVTFPILGNIPTFAGCNLIEFFQKLVKVVNKYGPVVRFWMGNKLYIVITDSESIENIFVNKALFKKNSSVSQIANGNGALPDDDKWKIHRRIISSTFNSNVLDQFMGNFVKNSFILTENIKPFADDVFDVYSSISSCALDIICETTMGTNVNAQMEEDPEYKSKLLQAIETLGETFKKPWMLNDWINCRKEVFEKERESAMKLLHKFVNKVITEKLASGQNGGRQKSNAKEQVEYVQWVRGRELSLLDLLIRDQNMKIEDIRDELSSLIVAGTKVTAITCCYVLSLLGVHQDVQEKVMEEQERIFEPEMDRPPTTTDVNAMKYLEQVLKETLRLYPPVPFLFRNIEEDTNLQNGFILPRGSYAVIFSFMTHRNPDYYPNPERFDPERFSTDCPTLKHPYSYIPFGGGRRICVAYKYGMLEVKTILSTLLRKYRVSQTIGGVEALERSLQAGVVLKPAAGFNLKMSPRPVKVIPSIFREE